jgi:hypothetical protein
MYWPFKTTVKFITDDGRELRLEYLISANNSVAAKYELEQRFIDHEVFGYTIERVEPATKQEAEATSRLRSVVRLAASVGMECCDGSHRAQGKLSQVHRVVAQSAVVAIAIRRSNTKRVQHMPRHNEAKKSGCDDCKDHERDDLLHDDNPYR